MINFPSSMPYDTVKVVDRSTYEETVNATNVVGIPTGPIAYIPFISPRGYGEDNKLVYINAARLNKYGTPNLAKYGLSLYLAHRFIDGGGTILGMRVVPKFDGSDPSNPHGESYANACIYAVVNSGTKEITYGVAHASPTALQPTPMGGFMNFSNSELGITVSGQEVLYKLFIIRAKSAGDFANKTFKFAFSADNTTNAIVNANGGDSYYYRGGVQSTSQGADVNMSFTFSDGNMYNGDSMDPEDVFDSYSDDVVFEKVYSNGDSTWSGLNEFLQKFSNDGANDILLATSLTIKEGAQNVTYTIDNSKIISQIELDGACPLYTERFTWDNDPFAADLAMAYGNAGVAPNADSGNKIYTDMIYNQLRYPFQYIFAPSMDEDLVGAIHDLVLERDITHAFYIVPYETTYAAQRADIDSLTVLKNCNDFREHFYPEWAIWKDPYTGKRTRFPAIYGCAYSFPRHWLTRKGRPYAGAANFVWNDYYAGTMVPFTTSKTEQIANHDMRLNTMVEDGRGSASPLEQITAQENLSALSECNNSFILTDIIRICLNVANNKRWVDLGTDEISSYANDVLEAVSYEHSGNYNSISIVSKRETVNGAGRNRIECAVNITFKDILKGVSYVFYISANS